MTFRSCVALGLLLVALGGCSSSSPMPGVYKLGNPYQIEGRWYYPEYDPNYDRLGLASWYGKPFHGRRTANGERVPLPIFDLAPGSVCAAISTRNRLVTRPRNGKPTRLRPRS